MNITELARRLRARPDELRDKLPDLGFAIGRKAIKVDNRQAMLIQRAWSEMKRKERLAEKVEGQKARKELKDLPDSERKEILLPTIVTVRDFASLLEMPIPRLMQELMINGILASINERIDFDTASIIAEDMGFRAVLNNDEESTEDDVEGIEKIKERVEGESKENLLERPPVIVVMGHVDHGKTRLLDAIRSANVMDTEAGGITQHIGAYQVERNGRQLTFIDTPGHEAFTVMRSRGAKVADIAIIVVAADDGVQPQTREAVNIAKSAHLPFVIALNKIDREESNLDKVKSELGELDLVPEDWGGKTIMVPISAKQGTNIEELLDNVLLVADLEKENIVANPSTRALGTVIESHVNPGSGPVATILVQSGTLNVGDYLGVRGSQYGRVRAMNDWKGDAIKSAPPSTPAMIIGWKMAPAVGDIMEVPVDVKALNRIKATDMSRQATEDVAAIKHFSKDSDDSEGDEGKKILNLIIRADVLGSLEAILGMLDKIQHEEVGVKVIQKGLGNITDADVNTAEASKAILIGFNVKPGGGAAGLAREKNVEIKEYTIIYKLFEEVLAELETRVPSETITTEQGQFVVLKIFRKTDKGWIVGGQVKGDKIYPGAKIRLKRGDEYVSEGEIISLQLGPSELKEAQIGHECGMRYRGKVKPEEGDIMEAYSQERKAKEFKIEGITLR